jgi:hypothetical protein
MLLKIGILTLGFFLSITTSFAQKNTISQNHKHFEIINVGSKYAKNQIDSAMEKADWCGYFNNTSRLKLNFDDGTVVELLSGEEDFDLKTHLNENCFQSEVIEDKGLFKIHESGTLVKMLSARNTSKN